jgi:hypothetical protein
MVKRVSIFVAILSTIVFNYVLQAYPMQGKGLSELSDKYQTYFQPAGYAFAIWGLIYLGLLTFAVFQLTQKKHSFIYERIWAWVLVSCAANVLWLVTFQFELLVASLCFMAILWFSLFTIVNRLHRGLLAYSRFSRFLLRFPFSLYFGWITAAFLVNISIVLDYTVYGFPILLSEVQWSEVLIIATAVLAAVYIIGLRDFIAPLAIAWALIGIQQQYAQIPGIANAVWIACGGIGFALFIQLYFLYKQKKI